MAFKRVIIRRVGPLSWLLDAMKIPSVDEWGTIDRRDLDALSAFKTFLGKSSTDAEAMFQTNAYQFQEDLQSMPAIPFNFYVQAFIKHLNSPHAAGDADGASSFLHLVAWLLKSNPGVIYAETKTTLLETSFIVSQQQEYYDADSNIYGDFKDLYNVIEQRAGI